jgi:hypothetical protein
MGTRAAFRGVREQLVAQISVRPIAQRSDNGKFHAAQAHAVGLSGSREKVMGYGTLLGLEELEGVGGGGVEGLVDYL